MDTFYRIWQQDSHKPFWVSRQVTSFFPHNCQSVPVCQIKGEVKKVLAYGICERKDSFGNSTCSVRIKNPLFVENKGCWKIISANFGSRFTARWRRITPQWIMSDKLQTIRQQSFWIETKKIELIAPEEGKFQNLLLLLQIGLILKPIGHHILD